MTDLPQSGRRALLAMLAGLPAATRTGKSLAAPTSEIAAPFAEHPKLLVAGPRDGMLNRWADALLPALEQSLPPVTPIRRMDIGSADGVTGANQFEARGAPDGLTVLLAPGQAALAWMIGDPRAQYDVGRWVPVMAGTSTGIVVGRPTALTPDGRARVAAASPASADLAILLGMHLLGAKMEPVFGVVGPEAARSAFSQAAVDVVLVHGHGVPEQLTALTVVGAQPLFTLGGLDDTGLRTRDPAYPVLPHFAELYGARDGGRTRGPLYDAWSATAAAAQLEFGLVLPQLTPASMVAMWRRAGVDAVASIGVQAAAASVDVRPLGGAAATANTAVLAARAPALQELRRWLAGWLNWRPA
jgi:hypothetical protein